MPNLKTKRFSNPETLKRIGDDMLIRLLSPFRDFFINRGLVLPAASGHANIDYDALAEVLMSPDTDSPDELADILYYMHEMSTPEAMDNLLDSLAERDLHLSICQNPTPTDVAVHVWLAYPDLLREKHAEQHLVRPRSFISFVTDASTVPEYTPPDCERIRAIEASLDEWFQHKKRGRCSRVYPHHKDGLVWFLVRHGEPYKREGRIQEDGSGSVYYRPEKHDVLIYAPAIGELRIHAGTKGERELYRKTFGFYLFGRDDFFPGNEKYTLEPLKQGRSSLVCSDIDGIDSIVMKEIEFTIPGAVWEREIHKADDVFTAFENRSFEIRDHIRISRASFKVQFSDSQKARTVTIRPSNNAQYGRDEDSVLVEHWLNARGFIVGSNLHDNSQGLMAQS
jgi:hypothetical protein